MKRRDFIAGSSAAALAWPWTAHGQTMPVIGFLHGGARDQNIKRLAAFYKGLGEEGFVEGQNVAIEYRWTDGKFEKLPEMANELVSRQVALIAALGSTPAALAARRATSSVPIVFAVGADPVKVGLVGSMNRPGENITGVTSLNSALASKRFGVLRDLVPQARHCYSLVNPQSALTENFVEDLQAAAKPLGIQVESLLASTDAEIDAAFAGIPQRPGTVMVFPPDSFFYIRRERIGALVIRQGIPAIFDVREYAEAGGLMSYGTDFLNVMQLSGNYVGRVLKGAKPGDLAVQQASKFEMVINLKTAKVLGIEVPPKLLFTADAVIE
jgi:putative ABC transport system substrate-binding protein